MTNGDPDTWDVIVLGGGPPGENAAQYATSGSDRRAVIVEAELVGGECSYWACMPSKALLRPFEVADAARGLPGFEVSVDPAAVLRRRDTFTHHHDDASQVAWAEGAGIDVVRGHGRLVGERRVEVTGPDGSKRRLEASQAVVLATGSRAAMPPVPGLADAKPWTTRDVTNLQEIPARVAVIGGGPAACEAVSWLRALGSREVTIIETAPRLLDKLEPFAGELLAERFAKAGIEVLVSSGVESVERQDPAEAGEGRIHGGPLVLKVPGAELELDELVVAAGRRPRSDDIGLLTVGLDEGGYVATDEHMTVKGVDGTWLYAVGDVTGQALLTHMGKYQARVAGAAIAARAEGRPLGSDCRTLAEPAAVPAVVFTDPQVASVGLREADARGVRVEVEAVEVDLGSVAGATLLRDDYAGRAKLVIDRSTDTIVGATFVGSEIAELLHSATVAVIGKVPLSTLWHAVPSYPTVSEVWLRLLEACRSASGG